MNSLAIKLIAAILGLSAVCGGAWKVYSLIQENAVLEASVEARDKAMSTYANEVNSTIAKANSDLDEKLTQVTVLQELYRSSFEEEQDFNNKVDEYDYGLLAFQDPEKAELLINISLIRLHDDISSITGATKDNGDKSKGETTKAIASDSSESKD